MLGTPKRDRRAERREATRAEILEAAWEQVRAEGLAALSLRDLAARVGMQAPSLYSYFDSKHAIYDAMFAEGAQEFLDRSRAIAPTGDALRDLQSGARMYVEFCTENPVRYQLMFQRIIPGFEPSPESYAIAVEALEVARERLARAGLTDPRDLDLFTAMTAGLTNQQISNDPGGDRWVRLVDEAFEMLFEHVSTRTKAKPNQRGTRK
jgi:AcrR family transcriptional regulator